MRTATSLTVLAIGAIFAFAITASPSFLNLQIVGWILMLTVVAGLLLSRRSQNWLRRTVIVRGSPGTSGIPRTRRRPVRRQLPPPAARPPAQAPAPMAEAESADATGIDEAGTDETGIYETGINETQPIERETIDEYIEQ